jgi:hypothetical protein
VTNARQRLIMSGLEVVGVVLGSIPLIISALEHYRDGVSTIQRWRRYERERQSLVRSLKTERVKMHNICEKLLVGLVSPSQVQAMIQSPFGTLWQEDAVKRKIRARLGDSIEVFESNVEEMRDAMYEMMQRLGLDQGAQSPGKSKSFISKEFQRVAFAISRSSYEDILSKMRNCTSDLEALTNQTVSLEPERQESSQVRLLTLLRDLSIGLYNALKHSLSCATCSVHTLNLELCTRPSDIMYGESETSILKRLCMNLAFAYPSNPSNESSGKRWEELRFEPLPTAPEPALIPQPDKRQERAVTPEKPKTKSVKFSSFMSSASSTSSSSTTLNSVITITKALSDTHLDTTKHHIPLSAPILDLCSKVRASQKSRQTDSYGFITDGSFQAVDPKRRYQVYPLEVEDREDSHLWSSISLSEVLRRSKSAPPLGYGDKLRLAVVIATSVLQLYQTPWLPHALTADDIFFIQKRYNHVYESAFIMRRLPEQNSGYTSLSKPRDPTLLSLGFLLIELLLGQTIITHKNPTELSNSIIDLEETYIAAQNFLPRVRNESLNYFSAVHRCLDGDLHRWKGDKNDPDFRHSMYSGIVALLKKDLEVL